MRPEVVTEGTSIVDPGFLEFLPGPDGPPDERLRHAVRRALEFLLGRGFGLLGRSELDEDGKTIRAELTSPFVPGGFGPALPPALLHRELFDSLDETLVCDFIGRYVELEAAYDVNRAVWLYLNARHAPLDMAAGYVGAAFEIMRRGYYEQPENEERSRLLPRREWTRLSTALESTINSAGVDDACKQHLRKRLGNLNDVSGTRLNELFLDDLQLQYSKLELDALQARNDAAHGNPLDPDEAFAALIRYRALHTLFARVMFAVSGVPVRYFDYSSLGHPHRPLAEQQGPRGGG